MKWLLSILILISLPACFRQDVITIELQVPQMRSDDCARLVLQSFGRLEADAILRAEPNVAEGTLRVTYNSMRLAIKNIEYAITAAGFDVNEERARPEARQALPERCR